MRAEGSVGFLGEKNLEAKYQKTTMRMIPVRPNPPCGCCCRPCGAWAPSTAGVGGAISEQKESDKEFIKQHRYVFQTKSQVDVLDDGIPVEKIYEKDSEKQ